MIRRLLAAAILVLVTAPADARKAKTELEKELKGADKRDWAAARTRALEPFAAAPNPLGGYMVSHNVQPANVPEMTALLNEMAQVLLSGWTAGKPEIRIQVIADPRVAGFAWAPGLITVSTGMIDGAQSIHGIAAILAHEIAHVLLGHADQRERTKAILSTATSLITAAPFYAEAAKQKGVTKGAGKSGTLNIKMTPAMQDQLVTGFAADATLMDAFLPIAQARQEYEADRLAVDLLVASKIFAADGQAETFFELAKAEARARARMETATDAVSTLVARQVLTSMSKGSTSQPSTTSTLAALGAASGVQVILGGIGKRASGRADEDERRAKYLAYQEVYGGEYPLANEADPRLASFNSRLKATRAAPAWKAASAAARASNEVLLDFQSREAEREARASSQSQIVASPKPIPAPAAVPLNPQVPSSYFARAMLHEFRGQPLEARKILSSGAALPGFPLQAWLHLGELQWATGDRQGLAQTISRGSTAAGRDLDFLPLKTAQAAASGQAPDAEVLAARCLLEGGAPVYQRCAQALGYNAACAPRTEPGKAAFAEARTSRAFADMIQVQRTAAGEGGAVACG